MRLIVAHARAHGLELVRSPSFSIPTLLFPAMFFLFFVSPRVGAARADLFLASYVGFAALGVAFFQFGVGIAADRASPWELFLRTLPVRLGVRFAARVAAAVAFALAAAAIVAVAAVLTTPAALPAGRWLLLCAVAVTGSVPFAVLGIALGY